MQAEVSGHADIDNEEDSDDEEQPTDCILKPGFKDVMNAISILEDYSLFSNFRADLMKAINDVNRAFDLDCLSNKKQPQLKIFSKLCKHFKEEKDKKKKNTLFLNCTVSLIRTLILPPCHPLPPLLENRIRETFFNSNLSLTQT